jgi:hypothetical protein
MVHLAVVCRHFRSRPPTGGLTEDQSMAEGLGFPSTPVLIGPETNVSTEVVPLSSTSSIANPFQPDGASGLSDWASSSSLEKMISATTSR